MTDQAFLLLCGVIVALIVLLGVGEACLRAGCRRGYRDGFAQGYKVGRRDERAEFERCHGKAIAGGRN